LEVFGFWVCERKTVIAFWSLTVVVVLLEGSMVFAFRVRCLWVWRLFYFFLFVLRNMSMPPFTSTRNTPITRHSSLDWAAEVGGRVVWGEGVGVGLSLGGVVLVGVEEIVGVGVGKGVGDGVGVADGDGVGDGDGVVEGDGEGVGPLVIRIISSE
jgi:hypothetical protein